MSHFFNFPINYQYDHNAFDNSVAPRVIDNRPNDNNYSTFSPSTSLLFQTHGDTLTDNSRITHVFIKGKNLTDYTIAVPSGQGTGTGLTTQTIPADQVVNGIQHDLRAIGPLMASEVSLTVTGTNTEIIEVMFLESVLDLQNYYTAIQRALIDVGASVRQNIAGGTFKVGGLADREKWNVAFEAIFLPDSITDGDAFLRALQENKNFTFAEDFSRWPDRVYPAYREGPIQEAVIGRDFYQRRFSFTIVEA